MSTHAHAHAVFALDTLFARKGEAAPTTARALFGTAPPPPGATERVQRQKDKPAGRKGGALAFLIQRANAPAPPPPPPLDFDWRDTAPGRDVVPEPIRPMPMRETPVEPEPAEAPQGKVKRHKMTVRLGEDDYLRCRALSESLGVTLQNVLETGIVAHLYALSPAAKGR